MSRGLGDVYKRQSVYLLFESIGLIEQTIITWSAQGLFWFLILFCTALFILFIPVEFLNTYKIFNSTFKDLILNIVFIIFTSLLFLIVFQFFLTPSNNIISDIIDIGKAISFSGFIALPLLLFLQHNLIRTINLSDNLSFNVCLFVWIISSQIFL